MAIDVGRIRALCFDVDGTLCDTDDQWVQSFERWLSPLRPLFPNRDPRPFARWSVMSLGITREHGLSFTGSGRLG
jgi:phosphoglycolate phosphatase-like HAD superfamily hydrolase